MSTDANISPAQHAYLRLRKHFLLVGEGITYALLALLDLLTHVVPSVSTNLASFKALDILVGELARFSANPTICADFF